MENETHEEHHEHHEYEQDKYPVKLTWKQVWIGITIGLTIIGSSFGTGVKVHTEIAKVEMSKVEQKCLEDISKINMLLLESNRKAREFQENMTFYQNQYIFWKGRYEALIEILRKRHKRNPSSFDINKLPEEKK